LVRERLSDERKKMIDVLFNAGRTIPEAMAKRFLTHNEKTATPTATSGIVLQPTGLARQPAETATVRPPGGRSMATARPSLIARGEAITVPPKATPQEQITARPPPKASKADTPGPRADRAPDSGPSDEPTRLAPAVSESDQASPGVALVAAPRPPQEPTEILLRRMKPSAAPFALALTLAVFALLWFALAHR
jgi:hypothetical protein